MKTIVEGKSNIRKLLGKQSVKETYYRLMRYVLFTECADGLLLHNVITGQLVLMDDIDRSLLEHYSVEYTKEMIPLIEDYFIVPDTFDEKEVVDKLRVLMKKLFTPKGINDYTVFTTTNCNARCFYCYQSDYPHITMRRDTANSLVDFMIKNKSKGAIRISWFGGEPLLGLSSIDNISEQLRENKIEFVSTMISNGYLFTEDIVNRAAKDWNLKSVQITLDGTERVYNKTKSYVSPEKNPFQRVMHNIEILLDRGIRVNIRLNLDLHNKDDLEYLLGDILERFPKGSNIGIYVHVLYENKGFCPLSRNKEISELLYKTQINFNTNIIRNGFSHQHLSLPHLVYNSCMADNGNAVVVYPDGSLYKCEHIVEEDKIGDIFTGIINTTFSKYIKTANNEKCYSCPLRPSCMILEECEGLKDRNEITCEFDIEIRTLALLRRYKEFVRETASTEENHERTIKYC